MLVIENNTHVGRSNGRKRRNLQRVDEKDNTNFLNSLLELKLFIEKDIFTATLNPKIWQWD